MHYPMACQLKVKIKVVHMKKFIAMIALSATVLVTQVHANEGKEIKEINWSTLNEHVVKKEVENPFEDMSIEHIRMMQQIAIVDDYLANGDEVDEESMKIANTARKTLADAGIDIEKLFAQREAIITQRTQEFESTNPALDNQNVAMRGFLLPIEFEGKKLKEFLLVPYVGACIHEPAPAPNQIVYAKLQSPIEVENLTTFTGVNIKGLMKNKSTAPELNLVDGSKNIPTSYTLEVSDVEFIDPYASSK